MASDGALREWRRSSVRWKVKRMSLSFSSRWSVQRFSSWSRANCTSGVSATAFSQLTRSNMKKLVTFVVSLKARRLRMNSRKVSNSWYLSVPLNWNKPSYTIANSFSSANSCGKRIDIFSRARVNFSLVVRLAALSNSETRNCETDLKCSFFCASSRSLMKMKLSH